MLLLAIGLAWAVYSATTWRRYGRVASASGSEADPLNALIADPEVETSHQARVGVPAGVALTRLMTIDLRRSPLVGLIFSLRTLPARVRGKPAPWQGVGLVEEMRGIGWGTLLEIPDRLFAAGAITQPWATEVQFRPLPPSEFAAFSEPGYAKIVWTLEAEPLSEHDSLVRTRTRVATTDILARRRFRRYWTFLSPGILLVHREILRLLRNDLQRLPAPASAPEGKDTVTPILPRSP